MCGDAPQLRFNIFVLTTWYFRSEGMYLDNRKSKHKEALDERYNARTSRKNSSAMIDCKVATEASSTPRRATGSTGTSITPSNLLELIKELKVKLKGHNDTLRNDIISLFLEINTKLDNLTEEMQGLKERVEETEARVGKVEDLTAELTEALITAVTDLESRSRRNNIHIFGVAEGEEGNSGICFVSGLLKRELPLPTHVDLIIQRAHRSLTPKPRPKAPRDPLSTFRNSHVQGI